MFLRQVIMIGAAIAAVISVAFMAYRLIMATPMGAASRPNDLVTTDTNNRTDQPASSVDEAERQDSAPPLRGAIKDNAPLAVSPAAPLAAQPAAEDVANPLIVAPEFDVVHVEGGMGTISGHATALAHIVLMDHEHEVAQADVDGQGHFSLHVPFAMGEHVLTMRQDIKELSIISQQSVTLLIEPDRMPLTALNTPDEPTRLLTPLPDHPDAPIRIDMIEIDEKGELSLRGQASAGSHIDLYVDNVLASQIELGQQREWQAHIDHLPAAGTHDIRADVSVAGHSEISARAHVPFTVPTPAAAPALVVRRGDSLWRISRVHLGRGIRYTEIYDINQDQISDPNLIFPGQKLNMPHDASP